ncbi:hypothetical protein AN639_06725 [Candidatus Epulonipiscium fishelsonii]|uniref:Uncharacterized protein n=1 Tax=Candidatus Epulonipiscium fishelsonii TaxID=77094 RepID=A0ACC8XGZ9_9FIRM|nr:hypothetical protein AN639_06725 [Epulopiscium sp. SCG-B05WGA-EpuloA1]ONI42784.1 hypothetical protein AN396_13305 [Epulopiscium sp. SCG-B11WGA-EpuloA1]
MVATFIKIPFGQAMVHLGSAAIFTTGILFGKKYACFAGAIGSTLFDILMGMSAYTLWSFIIKGIAGFLVGAISHNKTLIIWSTKGNTYIRELLKNIMAIAIAALWTLIGYIVAWSVVLDSFEIALTNIPASLLSSGLGLIVAIPLSALLKRPLNKYI